LGEILTALQTMQPAVKAPKGTREKAKGAKVFEQINLLAFLASFAALRE